MKAAPTIKTSERVGRWLGGVWRGIALCETRAIQWFVQQGIPARVGRLLFWAFKLAQISVLLYAAFWLVLLLVFGVAIAWVTSGAEWENEQEAEWRNGMSGFGLYRGDIRVDVGDPHEED